MSESEGVAAVSESTSSAPVSTEPSSPPSSAPSGEQVRERAMDRMDTVLEDRELGASEPSSAARPRARKPKAAPADWLTDEIRSRSGMFQISDDDIRSFGSADAAGRWLDTMEFAASLNEELEQLKAAAAKQTPQAPPREAPATPPDGKTAALAADGLAIKQWMAERNLDPDGDGADLLEVLTRFGKHVSEQIEQKYLAIQKPLQTSLAGQRNAEQLARHQRYIQQFDGAVEKLGEPWSEVFGKGATGSLPVMSNQRKARDRLDQALFAITGSYRQIGQEPPGDEDLLRQALWIAFPKESHERVYAEFAAKARRAEGSFSAPPGSRPTTPVNPAPRNPLEAKNAAMERMETVLRKKGM